MAGLNKQSDWEEYQENYSGIQNIQAQRQQNLANAKLQNMAANGQVDMAQQASGVMLDAMRPAQLNTTTQGILGKYGVQSPKTTRSQNVQRVGGNTTIINNNTTTYNTTTSDYGGPVQGRALAFKQQEASVGKFKLWLDNLFSQQRAETARRDREYEKRERALTKEQNKISRKLEGIGASIGKALDPRKNGQQSQLKTLLTMLGIGTLAKSFGKVLDRVEDLGGVFKYFGLSGGKFSIKGSEFEKDVVERLGGNSGETIFEAFSNLIFGEDGVYGRIQKDVRILLDERAAAIASLEKPKSASSFAKIAGYIGDVLMCAIGGSKFLQKSAESDLVKEVSSEMDYGKRTRKDKYRDMNDLSYGYSKNLGGAAYGDLAARESSVIGERDIKNGKLVNNTSSSFIQGKTIKALADDSTTPEVHATQIMAGNQRLKEVASRTGSALVDRSYLEAINELGFGSSPEELVETLGIEGGRYGYISRKMTAKELVESKGTSHYERIIKLVPEDYKLKDNEEYIIDSKASQENGGKSIIANEYLYKLTPGIISKIEEGLKLSFDVANENSMNHLTDLLVDLKKKKISESEMNDKKKQKLLKDIYIDSEDEVYSELFSRVENERLAVEETQKQLEEVKNREDRVYNSALKYNARTHRNISNALGETASPELTDFIYKSQEFINNTATRESRGYCGGAVRDALNAGGMAIGLGMDGDVYRQWLPNHGYDEIEYWNRASSKVNEEVRKIAQPGDIISIGPTSKHKHGHVAMCTTYGWVSDFKQETPLGLGSPGEYGDVALFRPTVDTLQYVSSNKIGEFSKSLNSPLSINTSSSVENSGAIDENSSNTNSIWGGGSGMLWNGPTERSTYSSSMPAGNTSFVPITPAIRPSSTTFSSNASHTEFCNNMEQLLEETNAQLNAISMNTKIAALAGSATADNTAGTKDGVAAVAQIEASKKSDTASVASSSSFDKDSVDRMTE